MALLVFAGCSSVPAAPPDLQLGGHPYTVGDLRVFVLEPADVAVACKGLPAAGGGCYRAAQRAIFTIPPKEGDRAFWVLIHEFKHALTPGGWHHE